MLGATGLVVMLGDPALVPIAHALAWLANWSPFAPAYAPHFAFAVMCLAQRLGLTPYYLGPWTLRPAWCPPPSTPLAAAAE